MASQLVDTPSVFINCPFDAAFQPLFDAIFFTVVASGFLPRSSIDGIQADGRIDRVLRALNASQYSIHDLSRCVGEGPHNLSRFNMPLELGMAMQLRYSQRDREEPHEWFVMTGAQVNYDQFVSDLKAFDVQSHRETTDGVVGLLVEWLQTKRATLTQATKPAILAALPHYEEAKQRAESQVGRVWSRLVAIAGDIAKTHVGPSAFAR